MVSQIQRLASANSNLSDIYKPEFYRLNQPDDQKRFNTLISDNPHLSVYDKIYDQLKELVKSLHPSKRILPAQLDDMIKSHLDGRLLEEYGVWVYYPWSARLVHLLDEEEFAEMRTNRNRYKITREEQDALSTKKIGIIGLSVGQSIALALAMERSFGELRLADFDTLDLSNLNRIRAGVHNIGVNKTYITAREIAEIDPFLNVLCYTDGITDDNLDAFLADGGKLDLLIDECDGLDVKIQCRYRAREMRIPVLMDTSDRGMLDVERFDLEPERPILHGLAGDIDVKTLPTLSNEDKIPIVLQIAGGSNISTRGKASMIEVMQTISTWPQLATSVILGGAVGADVTRRLLLNQFSSSGRYYIDLEQLVGDENKGRRSKVKSNPFKPLAKTDMDNILEQVIAGKNAADLVPLTDEQLNNIMEAAILSPSTGNDQPWKWAYKDGVLHLFHDHYYSFSFGDYKNIASFLTFGAVCENVVLKAQQLGLELVLELFPLTNTSPLIASFSFVNKNNGNKEEHVNNDLVKYIETRCTNRILAERKEIPSEILSELKDVAESVAGAELKYLTDPDAINAVGRIIAACDRMRILNEEGHTDFVNREMRWSPEDAERTRDGIDVRTLGLSTGQLSALNVIRDYDVIDFVGQVKGGGLLEAATTRSVSFASALALITMPSISAQNYVLGGRSYERMWLAAEKHDLAVHPVISPLYFFPRLLQGNGEGLSPENVSELKVLREQFKKIFDIQEGLAEVFLVKLAYAPKPEIKLLRKPVDEVLFRYN